MDMLEQVEQAAERKAARGNILGKIVTWYIDGNLKVPVERLRQMLDEAGLTKEIVPLPVVRQGRVLERALKNLRVANLIEEEKPQSGLVESVTQSGDRTVYQFTERARERAQDKLEYRQKYKLAWYHQGVPDHLRHLQRGTDPIIFMSQDGQPVSSEVAEKLEELIRLYRDVYISRDITANILWVAIASAGAQRFNPKGHPYFVPVWGLDRLDQLKMFMGALNAETGTEGRLRCIGAPDSEEDREEIGGSIMDSLMRDFDKLDYDLDERERDKDVVAPDTLDALVKRVDEVLASAQRYCSIATLRGVRLVALEERGDSIRKRALELKRAAEARPEQPRRARRAKAEDVELVLPQAQDAAGNVVEITTQRGRRLKFAQTEIGDYIPEASDAADEN